MIKELVKIASKLDEVGLTKEADVIDALIRKLAEEGEPVKVVQYEIQPGDTLFKLTMEHSKPVGKSLEDNIKLNKEKLGSGFNADKLSVGSTVYFWAHEAAEGFYGPHSY